MAYYDPKKTTVLQTDVSINGLGACLLQDEKPVYFASKALTEAQRGYVAIELESLAVAWAMEKFHHFLYGNHFLLESDQRPLVIILSRSLNRATPRLQRILIRTFPYNFNVHYLLGLKKPASRLLVQSRGTSRFYQCCPSWVYTKLQAKSMQEVAVYNNCMKLHKLMIPLPYSNILYGMGGQVT